MSSSTPPRAGAGRPSGAPNYTLRRIGALAIVFVVGYALVRMVGAYFGGEDGVAEGDEGVVTAAQTTAASGTAAAEDGDTEIIGLDDGTTVTEPEVEDTEPEPEPEPENTGPPTPNNPARVYIVGDSDAGTFGPYLETLLDGTLITTTELNYKVSSGLARPDFYNWPEELAAALPDVDPDIVVVTFGGNDSQGLSLPERRADGNVDFIIGDPVSNEAEWVEEYERRAGEVMDLLLEDDRAVIWVGIPNDDNPDVTARLALQDRAAKAAAAERPDVVFIDTWARFSGRNGGWADFVIDPRDGVGKDVRSGDGFHLNENGAEILAVDIAVAVQDELRALGANI